MRRSVLQAVAGAGALALGLTACGSAASTGGGLGGGAAASQTVAAGAPITIGVVYSASGSFAGGFTTTEAGLKARLGLANAAGGVDGHQINYVLADDQSTPQGALAAAKDLVQNKHVFAIITNSSVIFGAADYLKTSGVPVVSDGYDGFEWGDPGSTNFFSAGGSTTSTTPAATTFGAFFKQQGVTKMTAVGYSDSPSAMFSANSAVQSAQAVGIATEPPLSLPSGSTDVGAIVAKIKADGIDGLYVPTIPQTAFAILVGLKQAGVTLKAALLPTGYGGDLLGSPAAVQAGQGVDFLTSITPIEMNNAGTQQLTSALKTYGGVTGAPTFAEYVTYLVTGAFVHGVQAAGPALSQASFISSLRKVTSWDGDGLYPDHALDFSKFGENPEGLVSPDNCMYVVKLQGNAFVPLQGATPVCGTPLSGAGPSAH